MGYFINMFGNDRVIIINEDFDVIKSKYKTKFIPRIGELIHENDIYYKVVNVIHKNKIHWVVARILGDNANDDD